MKSIGYTQQRNPASDQIDFLDTAFVLERLPADTYIARSEPAPISTQKGAEHTGEDKINPHVSRFFLNTGAAIDVFHVKPVYYLHVDGGWRPMSEIAHFYGNKTIHLKEDWADKLDLRYLAWLINRATLFKDGKVTIPSPSKIATETQLTASSVNFTVSTFYPDANTETTSVDGVLQDDNAGSTSRTWAQVHDNSTGGARTYSDDSGVNIEACADKANDSGNWHRCFRGFTLFDTSAIDDADSITATTLSLYGNAKADGQSDTIGIVQTNPASNTSLAFSDFVTGLANLHSDTVAASMTIASYSTSGYNDFTFNATGLTWISVTGVTKLGQRVGLDYNESGTHSNLGTANNSVQFASADTSGTSQDPKLAVTHGSATSSTPKASFFI